MIISKFDYNYIELMNIIWILNNLYIIVQIGFKYDTKLLSLMLNTRHVIIITTNINSSRTLPNNNELNDDLLLIDIPLNINITKIYLILLILRCLVILSIIVLIHEYCIIYICTSIIFILITEILDSKQIEIN